MLLPDTTHPHLTLFFNGSLVLDILLRVRESNMLDLYIETKKLNDISMPLFVLSLDWLYLAELVKLNQHGNIELCS